MNSKYVWLNMNSDIHKWTHACLACQWSKVHVHTMSPIGRFRPPDSRFAHVHVDLVGPLPTVNGHTHLLTCVDRFMRWPEAILLTSTTMDAVTQAFLTNWVAHFAVPSDLTSDHGAQFESSLWQHMMKLLGIHCSRTTAYHPSANGLVERFHCQLLSKASLIVANSQQ